MLGFDGRQRMAALTQGIDFFDQEIGIFGLMRLMAGKALPLGEGSMSMLGVFGQFGMALKAEGRGRFHEQGLLVGGVRIVAFDALTLSHRLMDHPLRLLFGRLSMA